MRIIISFCLLWICQLALFGQAGGSGNGGGYDPANPADPQIPVMQYKLQTEVIPAQGGSTNLTGVNKYAEGSRIYLRAYNNTGYNFVNWLQGDSVVSASYSFYYTMPAKNVILTAVFSYNPENPADPDSLGLNYTLTVEASPKQGGSFNASSIHAQEGTSTYLYAYANSGYRFKGWKQGDSILSTSSPYYYIMGHGDARVVGIFEYNPGNPSNPNANSWNPTIGEVVVDDFTPGSLWDAIYKVVNGNSSKVTTITVAGQMTSNDFGFANNCGNCTWVDLSRTYGYTSVPSYSYNYNNNLNSIILPACIENIEYRAFDNCSNLSDITCYAPVPPTVGGYAFRGITEGAVLHVLSSSISLYAEADGWKDFTILPLSEEVRSLQVNLPDGSEDGRYKNMVLELVNAESGQKQKYVVSDRVVYTFNGLLKKTRYNIYLKTPANVLLGQIEDVEIKDEDVTVAFESLLSLYRTDLKVVTPQGDDVTDQTQVSWFDANNTYLLQGTIIDKQTTGTQLAYRVVLPQALGTQYILPALQNYVVAEQDSTVIYTLQPIDTLSINGIVKDLDGMPLSGATVSVSQKLNGKYSKAFIAQTDKQGAFKLCVYNDQSTISVSATDYISQTLTKENFNESSDLGTISLKSVTGATITTNFTYTASAVAGETAETQNWYSDYANVAYTLYNVTQNKAITEYNVQYPSIVLLEEVAEGDLICITAAGKTNAFVPVEATAVIDASNRAAVTFPIVALGGIKATFVSTENAAVAGILYNSKGELVKKYTYSNASLSINDLADGEYTLLSMVSSTLFNSILKLSQVSASGLTEGSDYVLDVVTVKSGIIATIANDLIPALDESKLYYTGDNTLFSVNKSSIVAGNYLTLKGKIDFKSTFASSVNDVKMIVDLPESCSFVENSVMVGSKVSSYTLDGTRLTIPLERYSDQVRFCIIPTEGGEYNPNAFAQFTIDGKEVLQPIGSAVYTVKDLTITVPTTIAKTTLPISGTALGNSEIAIYDNGTLIGQTTSLANGMWSTTCELQKPYNLSTHQIYAKVTTKTGLELISETSKCFYDKNAIRPLKVTMYHWNPEMQRMFESVFNFNNPTTKPNQWTVYYPKKQFTYTIEFTNNSPDSISDVVLYIHTADGKIVKTNPHYNASKDVWTTDLDMGNSCDSYYPVNVSLDFSINTIVNHIDYSEIENIYSKTINLHDSFDAIDNNYQTFLSSIDNLPDNIEQQQIDDLFESYEELINISADTNQLLELYKKYLNLNTSDRIVYKDSVKQSIKNNKCLEIINYYKEKKDLLVSFNYLFENDDLSYYVSRNTCDGLTPQKLLKSDYRILSTAEGDTLYIKSDAKSVEIIDFRSNFRQRIEIPSNNVSSAKRVSINGMWEAAINKLDKCNGDLVRAQTTVLDAMVEIAEFFGNKISNLTNQASILKAMAKVDREMGLLEGSGELLESARGLEKQALELEQQAAKYKKFAADAKVTGNAIVGKAVQLLGSVASLAKDVKKWWNLNKKIESKIPCEGNESYAEQLNSDVTYYGSLVCLGDVITLSGAGFAVYSAAMGLAGTPLTGGLSTVIGGGAGLICAGVSIVSGIVFDYVSNKHYDRLKKEVDNLKCENDPCKDKPCPDDDDNDGGDNDNHGGSNGSGNPDDDVQIDPSGYVYEGVSSNRVQGATATCYYKETVEDMYGDLHDNIVLWDAEEYAQENPLFTDEMGMYRWDVPQGLWQVKFEKDGYQTTYSEWLPVPPPQLEVNIAMTQSVQPTVSAARAYEDGIEVEFDKYMQPESLTTDNIFVTKNNVNIVGTVTLLNEEQAYEDNYSTYASKVRFIPEVPFLTTDEITLTVSRKVKSYAGIQMEDDYIQDFDIVKEIKSIVADSLVKVLYNGEKEILVSVLPYDAAIGKKLTARSSSPLIFTVTGEAVLDENGQARLTLTGELPGTSMINFSVEDATVTSASVVNVVAEILTPIAPSASRASGTSVYRNTSVALSTDTKNAIIYYTVDGTCPCDENGTRVEYSEPIVITDDITIKAMTMTANLDESEVSTFTYTIKKTALGMDMKEGWNWISHNLETAVTPATLADEGVERFVGQTAELVRDPQYGLMGNLHKAEPTASYKVQMSAAANYTVNGYECNAAEAPVALHTGWNWIGYPVNQTMSITEALADADAENLDYIVGQDGFAQYADGTWQGTLETMIPGKGYLYNSVSDKSFVYNTSLVSKARYIFGKGKQNVAPWAVDKYRYPKVMCLVSNLYKDRVAVDADVYSVGAFCGTECRGIGRYVNGKLMMNIYGSGNETITFRVVHNVSEEEYEVTETAIFGETMLGNLYAPYSLHIGDVTSVSAVNVAWGVYPSPVVDKLFITGDISTAQRLTLTDTYGKVVLIRENIDGHAGVDVSRLTDGIYILTLVVENETYYKKIVKVGN